MERTHLQVKKLKHLSFGPLLEVEMSKKCALLWREARLLVKKKLTFGPLLEVEMSKKCAPVWSEHICKWKKLKNTSRLDHFWKVRCRKSARCCGAKHISMSKFTKHTMLGPLLEVQMSKKCTPLWREAHFQVKIYKTHHARTTVGS